MNAALGGNFVNAMDLMTATDPAERFGMIRDAISQTGLSFDEMSYYQKQFYAESLGLEDTSKLALLMSGDMDALGGSVNQSSAEIIKMNEDMKAVQSIGEAWNAILRDNSKQFVGLATTLNSLVKTMGKYSTAIEYGIYILGGLKLAMMGVNAVQAIATLLTGKHFGATGALIASQGTLATSIAANTAAMQAAVVVEGEKVVADGVLTGSQNTLNTSTKATGKSMWSFVLPVLAVGAAVYMAATGIGNMADAFSKLSVEQMIGLGIALTGIAVALKVLIPAISGVGAVSQGVSLGLLALGAAVFMIGTGVALAALGVSELVNSMSNLGAFDFAKVAIGVGLFGLGIFKLSAALMSLANPAAAIGMSVLLGVGAAAAGIGMLMGVFRKEKKGLEEFGPAMESFAMVDTTQMEAAVIAFESMKESINDMSGAKLGFLAASMQKITLAYKVAGVPTANQDAGSNNIAGARQTSRSRHRKP